VIWRSDVWTGLTSGRPLEAYVNVANPTAAPIEVAVRLAFIPTGARTQRATVAVGETVGWKIRTLLGSRVSDVAAALSALTVTCNGGAVACPVSVTWMTAPTCEVTP
jgi:hypothetical protein